MKKVDLLCLRSWQRNLGKPNIASAIALHTSFHGTFPKKQRTTVCTPNIRAYPTVGGIPYDRSHLGLHSDVELLNARGYFGDNLE